MFGESTIRRSQINSLALKVAKSVRSGGHYHGRTSTTYFATFELKSGERMEFGLYGKDYGLLVEGDEGELTFQGTWYHGFERRLTR